MRSIKEIERDLSMEKISVIVPIYNVEEFLPRCIDSLINQTYSNLEIILVDDGSPDKCGVICDGYKEKDSRIIVIHKENGGLSDARNVGLKISSGKYVSFVDSDDYVHPQYYEVLYRALISNNSDIVVCECEKVYDIKNVNYEKKSEKIDFCSYEAKEKIMNNFFNKNCGITVIACNKLFKKELFSDIEFPKGKIHEDEATTYRVFYKSRKVTYINQPLYFYYQRQNSITGEKLTRKNFSVFDTLAEVIDFYKNNNEKNLKKKAVIRYFKIIQLYINRLIKENIESQNSDLIRELKSRMRNDAKNYKVQYLIPIINIYGFMKRLF